MGWNFETEILTRSGFRRAAQKVEVGADVTAEQRDAPVIKSALAVTPSPHRAGLGLDFGR